MLYKILKLILIVAISTGLYFWYSENYANFGDIGSIETKITTNKKVYSLNEQINFTQLFQLKPNKDHNVGINVCQEVKDKNILTIIAGTKNTDTSKHLYQSERIDIECPEELSISRGLISFKKVDSFRIKYSLKFLKNNNLFYLKSEDGTLLPLRKKLYLSNSLLYRLTIIEAFLDYSCVNLEGGLYITVQNDKCHIGSRPKL